MAELGKATRRGLLAGVVGSGLLSALGFPAAVPVQAAPVPEDPWLRARRLARELSDALVDLDHGDWYATVYPRHMPDHGPVFFGDVDALDEGPLLADDVTGTTAYADWEAARSARVDARRAAKLAARRRS